MSIQQTVDNLFSNILSEITFKPNVKRDPKTANVSGQAPGDTEADAKMAKGEISLEDIIDRINAIRAGHSLKDVKVATALEKYVNELDVAEKTALYAYLKGISEIVAQQKTGEAAVAPEDPAPNVEMQKKNIKDVEGQVVKKSHVDVKHNRGGGNEKIASPLPITPKNSNK